MSGGFIVGGASRVKGADPHVRGGRRPSVRIEVANGLARSSSSSTRPSRAASTRPSPVLKKRGLSVHLVMDAWTGRSRSTATSRPDILWHASQHNGASFWCRGRTPYYPSYLPGTCRDRVIKAPAHKGEQCPPTPAQAGVVAALVR